MSEIPRSVLLKQRNGVPPPTSSELTIQTQSIAPLAELVLRQIDELPDPSRKGLEELQIHHERIADFKDKSGHIVGMNSMIMGFPPGPGVKMPDLKKGEKIEFDFEVVWTGNTPFYFTAIRKLSPETALDFSK